MDKKRANKIIKFLTKKLQEDGLNLYKVILFGSYYNGEPNEESDIDIAIVSDDFKGKDILELGPMTGNALRSTIKKFDIPIDLIKLTIDEYENETRLSASYVKEGKVVYSSSKKS
jgi:predicted nucleotidyltransferase